MGYATPWIKNRAYSATSGGTALYTYAVADTNNTDVYKTYLSGTVAESVIQGSQLRFAFLLDQECDVLLTINGVTVINIVQNYVGATWESVYVDFDSELYPPGSIVTIDHRRNGAAPAESRIERLSVYGWNTPIILNP